MKSEGYVSRARGASNLELLSLEPFNWKLVPSGFRVQRYSGLVGEARKKGACFFLSAFRLEINDL